MSLLQAQVRITDPNAVFPTKGTSDSVGYDLTAIAVSKILTVEVENEVGHTIEKVSKTTLYDTGLIVKPPEGFYFEIVARSSLSKTGYVLSNSIGIIDPDYRGNLLIALTKVDDTFPDLKVPFTRCQLVLRKKWDCEMVKVDTLDETQRGSGGFGSTDYASSLKRAAGIPNIF